MVTPERQDWIDRAKGILIFLVVLGHVVGAAGNLAQGCVAQQLLGVRSQIYLFHMPAFFVLAGLAWRRREIDFVSFLRKKAVRLLVPYAVFGLLSVGIYAAVVGYDTWWQPFVSLLHAGAWPDGVGFRCNSVLWFLPVMFVSLCCWYWIDRLTGDGRGRAAKLLLLGCMLWSARLAAYRYRIGYWPWGVVSVVWYLPFVMIGNVLRGALRGISLEARRWSWLGLLMAAGAAFALVDVVMIACRCNLMQWSGIACHVGCGLLGSLACFALAQDFFFAHMRRFSALLVKMGGMSLGIMLLHKFFVVALQEHVGCVRSLFGNDLLLAVSGVGLVTVFALSASCLATMVVRKVTPALGI